MMAEKPKTAPYREKLRGCVVRSMTVLSAMVAALAVACLLLPQVAWSACVCGSGRMTGFYPGMAPVAIDGSMSDWTAIMSNPNNNICDGPPGADLDAPVQSTGRDLQQFTYTFDSSGVYAFTQRVASESNTDNFIYYADTNNNGIMESGEPVIVVGWQGSNRAVDVYLGRYQPYYAGGDPMVCTPGYTGGQSCTPGYADGYHLPGRVVNLPSAGQPNYSGQWGSAAGTEMEWYVTWADLGMSATPGRAFSFHVGSTNSQPGAGSFPAQVDDNMGGCGGGGGSTQYAELTLVPNQLITLSTATTYTTTHTLTNTGNGNDNFTLSSTISGSNNPIPTVTYLYNGQAFTDTSTLGANFSIAPGAAITLTVRYTFPSSPAGKNYSITTTARSKYDTAVSASAVDTLTSQSAITILKRSNGGYGTFTFGSGTNGLPASLQLTTTAGNNPAASPGYSFNPAQSAAVTETVAPGWQFNSGTCVYAATGAPVTAATFTSNPMASPPTAVLNIDKSAFATIDNINCTFTSDKLPIITVQKLLANGGRISDADQFTIQLLSGGAPVAASATTGTGSTVDPGTGTIPTTVLTPGGSYSVNEFKSAGPTAANLYTNSLACTNNGVPVSLALGQGLTPAIGDSYLCYITNAPKSPVITLDKALAGSGRLADSDQFTVQIESGATVVNDTTAATTAGTGTTVTAGTGTTGATTVTAGTPCTLAEIAAGTANLALYDTQIACANSFAGSTTLLPAAGSPGQSFSITPSWGDDITCTLTNSRKATVTVVKNLVPASDPGTFDLSVGGSVVRGGATDGQSGIASVTPGVSVTVSEAGAAGTSLANYTSTYSCTGGGVNLSGNGTSVTIPGGSVTAGAAITCTFTNTLIPATVRIAELANGSGTFGFTMTNLSNGSDSITVTTPPGTPATVTSSQTSAALSPGTDVTIQESSVPGGWPADPVSASCIDSNGAVSGNGSGSFGTRSGNSLLIPASYLRPNAQILCTFVNSAPGTGLVLVKEVDKATAYPGDTITYTITYANNSLDQLSNIVINDDVPAYTTTPAACCVNPSSACLGTPAAPYPGAITGCTTVTTSTSASWMLSGTLAPGAAGQVKLSVVIQQ